ncbi:MAG: TVP38/TMEM64 family protein [Gemmatimonadota bacterium]
MPRPGGEGGAGRPGGGGRSKPLALSLVPALLLAAGFGLLVATSARFRSELVTAGALLRHGDAVGLQDWLLGYGFWAPLVSGLLQVATSVFPPGPSFLLAIANAMLYGAVLGGLLTFVTALGAAAVCFGIARKVGRPGIERLVSRSKLERMDAFMQRHGILAVFLGRLIPFINPDIVSYAAGVTRIGWVPFLLAVGAGAFPSTVFYSVVGAAALEMAGWVILMVAVSTIVPLILLAWFWRRFFD